MPSQRNGATASPVNARPAPQSEGSGTAPDLDEIYRQLQRGEGHQWVNDDNVHALIEMAKTRGHALIEVELREWEAPCAPDVDTERILRESGRH